MPSLLNALPQAAPPLIRLLTICVGLLFLCPISLGQLNQSLQLIIRPVALRLSFAKRSFQLGDLLFVILEFTTSFAVQVG